MIRGLVLPHPTLRSSQTLIARAVLDRAAADFLAPVRLTYWSTDENGVRTRKPHPDRLDVARLRVDGGRFLLQRRDPIARLWFTLVGISVDTRLRSPRAHRRRLRRALVVLAVLESRQKSTGLRGASSRLRMSDDA